MRDSLSIAVVSPFLDKRHGTERCIAEQIERLAADFDCELHIYAQRVEDLRAIESLRSSSSATQDGERRDDRKHGQATALRRKLIWHKVPAIRGPLILTYAWWFLANTGMRWWDTHVRRLHCDLTYTPGINCLDADVSAIHIVFGEFRRLAESELRFRNNPPVFWPRLLHRKLYYRLIAALESVIYSRDSLAITVVSRQVAEEIRRHYRRERKVHVLYNAIDCSAFNMPERLRRRPESRRLFGIGDSEIGLLLIGNDWKKKGLPRVIEALPLLRDLRLKVMVAGRDDPSPFQKLAERLNVSHSLLFLEPSSDVMRFYAAADVYVAPSLHDSFAFPPLEAMASGLPVITSAQNGGSEIITPEHDGFVLNDPADVAGLAALIRRLCEDSALSARIGENAAKTVPRYTWDHNAAQLHSIFQEIVKSRDGALAPVSPVPQQRKC